MPEGKSDCWERFLPYHESSSSVWTLLFDCRLSHVTVVAEELFEWASLLHKAHTLQSIIMLWSFCFIPSLHFIFLFLLQVLCFSIGNCFWTLLINSYVEQRLQHHAMFVYQRRVLLDCNACTPHLCFCCYVFVVLGSIEIASEPQKHSPRLGLLEFWDHFESDPLLV